MKPSSYLTNFYNHYDEDSRLLRKHRSVEFLTTTRYVEKYIIPGNRILKIGADTGRYSHALARQGYHVDAVELMKHNIEIFQQHAQTSESVTITQDSVMDLFTFPDSHYDITLLLGPLYHLYTQEGKRQALGEAIRVTKPGGVIFAAYVISDDRLLDEDLKRGNINVAEYIENGLLDPQTFATTSQPKDLLELVHKENIDDLMPILPVIRLHYITSDGCVLFMRKAMDVMDDHIFDLYLTYHFATCEREDMLGVTSHSLDIFGK